MAASCIDGKALALELQEALKKRVSALTPRLGRAPGLAVVLVGDNSASQVYVKNKSKNAESCGLLVTDVKLPGDTSDYELQSALRALSERKDIDGILLQLPLPKGLDEYSALLAIAPEKDADGLHPMNQGLLLRGVEAPQPCTPLGVMLLIDRAMKVLGQSSDLGGKHAVVVGRSILVGKPAGMMLLAKNCTVEFCHSRTKNLNEVCRRGDILVAAIGKPRFLGAEAVREGAIVIDVGINRGDDGKLCGDVDFEAASKKAAAITPVPGGVGPMTIAMLLSNTVDAAERRLKQSR